MMNWESIDDYNNDKNNKHQVSCEYCTKMHHKCDKMSPCGFCVEKGKKCEINYSTKKRGRPYSKNENTSAEQKKRNIQYDALKVFPTETMRSNQFIQSGINPSLSGIDLFTSNNTGINPSESMSPFSLGHMKMFPLNRVLSGPSNSVRIVPFNSTVFIHRNDTELNPKKVTRVIPTSSMGVPSNNPENVIPTAKSKYGNDDKMQFGTFETSNQSNENTQIDEEITIEMFEIQPFYESINSGSQTMEPEFLDVDTILSIW